MTLSSKRAHMHLTCALSIILPVLKLHVYTIKIGKLYKPEDSGGGNFGRRWRPGFLIQYYCEHIFINAQMQMIHLYTCVQ